MFPLQPHLQTISIQPIARGLLKRITAHKKDSAFPCGRIKRSSILNYKHKIDYALSEKAPSSCVHIPYYSQNFMLKQHITQSGHAVTVEKTLIVNKNTIDATFSKLLSPRGLQPLPKFLKTVHVMYLISKMNYNTNIIFKNV